MVSHSSGTRTGPSQGAKQATRQDRVQRHRIRRVHQHDPGDLLAQQLREQAADGQDGHAPDAVPDQHDGAASRSCGEHGLEVPCHAFQAVVPARRLSRQTQSGQIPEHEAEAIS
jgi:hypothetical protein